MYDSLGPLLVVLRYKSKAKSDMVKWSQGGVLLVVSAWTDATSRTGQETKSAITMKAPLPVDMKAF